MNIQEFENTVMPGDDIVIYSRHHGPRCDARKFTFVGYKSCSGCPSEPCAGYVILKNKATGDSLTGCFRSDDNIRLGIKKQVTCLPDDLFEI